MSDDATPLQTQADRLAAAKEAVKRREDGIRAAAAKQGRQQERQDIFQALGIQRLEEASQLAQLRSERDARPTIHSYHRHGMARLFQGAFLGMCAGVIVAFFLLPIVANAVSGLLHEATITGAMVSSQREPAPQYQRQP